MYLQFREKASDLDILKAIQERKAAFMSETPPMPEVVYTSEVAKPADVLKQAVPANTAVPERVPVTPVQTKRSTEVAPASAKQARSTKKFVKSTLPPVMGPPVTNGSKPLFGLQHKGTDAIMALACKYPVQFYKRFVGSLRKYGYTEDIVLAVSTVATMKPGVEAYLKEKEVLSYAFDVECAGKDNCRFTDSFLGYVGPSARCNNLI